MWEQLTFWSEEPPAKTCPSRAKEPVSKEPVPASRLTLSDWLMKRDVNTSSGKTYPAYSVPTGAEISQPFYPCSADTPSTCRRMDGGQAESSKTADPTATVSRGECWTRNLPEFPAFRSPFPNAACVCSLSDVLETGNVPPQYYLSPTACRGILHRASKRGKSLPEVLEIALRRKSECAPDAMGGGKGALVGDNLSHTLQTGNDQTVIEFAKFWNGEQVAESLTTTSNNQRMPDKGRMQMVFCRATQQANAETLKNICPTITEAAGTSGNNQPVICAGFIGKNGSGAGSVGYEENVAPTQRSGLTTDVVCFHGSQDPISNETHANAIGRNGGLENCVCCDAQGGNNGQISGTITGDHNNRVADYTQLLCYENSRRDKDTKEADGAIGTLQAHMGTRGNNGEPMGTLSTAFVPGVGYQKTVRRLLPVECERLMGFPDNHTRISWNGKPEEECPDAPRYKACGNSMCVNCMEWIGRRIDQFNF